MGMMNDPPAYSRVALCLPLPSLAYLDDPTLYSQPIRLSIWSTQESLTVLFYKPQNVQDGPIESLRVAESQEDWNRMQNFLGVVYGIAGQEAARVGRMGMNVDVLVEGLVNGPTSVDGSFERVTFVQEESSEEIIARLFQTPPPQSTIHTIPTLRSPSNPLSSTVQEAAHNRHQVSALGGTFDHLHGGHKILLTMAIAITAKKLIVGLSADELLKQKAFPEYLEAFDIRAQHLRLFLHRINPRLEYDVVALKDVCGPTATDEEISALVVSRESISGGHIIDQTRQANSVPALKTYMIDVVSATHNLPTTQTEDVPSLLVDGTKDAQQLKELKLGSTYIRQWLSKQQGNVSHTVKRRKLNGNKTRDDPQPAAVNGISAMVPPRTSCEATSQRIRWTYSQSELRDMRIKLNQGAIELCKSNWENEAELRTAEGSSIKIPLQYPSWEDELSLLQFYAISISSVIEGGALTSGRFLPPVIESVAISYLKRFYLRTSVLEWHPKVIMPVCLFLAGKVCNYVFDIDHYVSVFDKLERDDILGIEFLVLQTLRFDVYIPRIQDAIHGWFLKLQDIAPTQLGRIETAYALAKTQWKRSRLTDVEFLYTPAQIAAACFRLADKDLFESALEILVPIQENKSEMDEDEGKTMEAPLLDRKGLLSTLEQVQAMTQSVSEDRNVDMVRVKAADKLVRKSQDPANNKASALYKKRIQEQDEERAKRRAARYAKHQKDVNDRDTFFGPQVTQNPSTNRIGTMGETGLGIPAEAGGMLFGGTGLKSVGMELDSSDSD